MTPPLPLLNNFGHDKKLYNPIVWHCLERKGVSTYKATVYIFLKSSYTAAVYVARFWESRRRFLQI